MEKLASINQISNITPILGRDYIALAQIDDMQVIIRKEEFSIGDKCVFVRVGALLPERPEFEFLKSKNYRVAELKMSGVVSQGIAFPLNILPEKEDYELGEDVSEVLGICQYEDNSEIIDDDDFDNTWIKYRDKNICIVLNDDDTDRRNKLKKSENILRKKFPGIKNLMVENSLQYLLDEVFIEGVHKRVYIRNLTFALAYEDKPRVLAIRPEKVENDSLSELLPEGTSLLFKGHVWGKRFVIDSIFEAADTECLDFEIECDVIPYRDEMKIHSNFLFDLEERSDSLTEHTRIKLEEWDEYLKWKKELASRQIFGCKYYKVDYDEKENRLIFWLVCKDEESFKSFRKYLHRNVQAFSNNYSNDNWVFDFAKEDRKTRFSGTELGRFKGVREEYYINNNEKSLVEAYDEYDFDYNEFFSQHPEYAESDGLIHSYESEVFENENEENRFEKSYNDNDLLKIFSTPYVAKVAFDLPRKHQDIIARGNFEEDEIIDYVYDNVLDDYDNNGFLALSAIGEFVLIDRFEKAIQKIENDECYSPNLEMWLFNIQKARTPNDEEIIIENWLNENIEKNENQKEAVRKMLKAPDVCLIQGPPGTGKTTVIAEAIYQFAKRGNRVLVASQSNDAVDNALDRLANTPEIRAIRLGQKSKKKRTENAVVGKYSEGEILRNYYDALSRQLEEKWLNKWNNLDENIAVITNDIRDLTFYNKDVIELTQEKEKKEDEIRSEKDNLNLFNKKITDALESNSSLKNERNQFEIFQKTIRGLSEEQFYLTLDQLKVFGENFMQFFKLVKARGLSLIPIEFDINEMDEKTANESLFLAFINIKTIKALIEKLAKNDNLSIDVKDAKLEKEIEQHKQKLMELYLDGKEEEANEYRQKINKLKLERDKLGINTTELIPEEKNVLSKELQEQISIGNREAVTNRLNIVLTTWDDMISNFINKVDFYMKSQEMVDLQSLRDYYDLCSNKITIFQNELEKINSQIENKTTLVKTLSQKYGFDGHDIEELTEHIKGVLDEKQGESENQSSFRNEWEQTMMDFKNRLSNEELFKYDQKFYEDIYVESCNVVGISCTDNMRHLTDRGYDDFDVVIIDEVSKATPPELLIPLMKGRKAILVGDHRQLPPMFDEHEKSYNEVLNNLDDVPEELLDMLTPYNFTRFKNMVTASLFKDYFEEADESIKHSLLVQYRMHSDIMNIINRFYENLLTTGLDKETEDKAKDHGLTISGVDGGSFINPSKHAYWIDSSVLPSGKPIYEIYKDNSTSAYNVLEKNIIIELLKKFAEEFKKKGFNKENRKTIGVISFYQMQINELKDALKDAKKQYDFSAIDVDINTVDRFQGKEKNIIITSLVRNNKAGRASEHILAFERINVAFSRAQELLVIVGARNMYEKAIVTLPNMGKGGTVSAPVYKNIIDDLNRKACFKTCNKIISPENEEFILDEYKKLGGK